MKQQNNKNNNENYSHPQKLLTYLKKEKKYTVKKSKCN